MIHKAFAMNITPPAGHLPAQWAVFCRQCSNNGNPKQIVPPAPLPEQQRFIKRHNGNFK